jgi:hypothetical protein
MAGRILYYGNIIREGLILFLDGPKKASYPGSGNSLTDFSDSGNNSTLVNGVGFNVNAFTFENTVKNNYNWHYRSEEEGKVKDWYFSTDFEIKEIPEYIKEIINI